MKNLALTVTLLGLWGIKAVYAAEFFCSSGDVSCLIAAINETNQNNEENTINLAPGTYTLTSFDNGELLLDRNGLPVITGSTIINGESAETTFIERGSLAVDFRIFEVAGTGRLTLNGVTVRGGLASFGAGIRNNGTLVITDSILDQNGQPILTDRGGGIRNLGTLTIVRSLVTSNVSEGNGTAIDNSGTADIMSSSMTFNISFAASLETVLNGPDAIMTINNSTISNNGGRFGGAAIINRGMMEITNSTIANNITGNGPNQATGSDIGNAGTLRITSSTLAGDPGIGSRIFNSETLELENTILDHCSGPITSLGNNIIGDLSGCSVELLETDLVGDPGLGEFIGDPAPGHSHFPLLANSQAIDHGNPDACPRTDQLGNRRVGVCDIGAVEFQGRRVLLTVRRDVIRAGRSLVVRWRGIPTPTSTDWIGLYLPEADDTAFIDWIYVSCSKTPGNPDRRGSCDFPVPASLQPGTYELRLLANDGFVQLATSDTFTVTNRQRNIALGSSSP